MCEARGKEEVRRQKGRGHAGEKTNSTTQQAEKEARTRR